MADAKPGSKPHVRFENRLVEAILDSRDMHEAHFRILMALARLTIGWGRRTASLTATDLAGFAGMQYSGGYRRALHDLVANNVVVQLLDGPKPTYAIQPDYLQWQKFGGNEGRLAARWDRRPASNDDLLRHAEATGQLALEGVSDRPTGQLIEEDETPLGAPSIEDGAPLGAPTAPPGASTAPRGTDTPAKSLFDETVGARKDIEIQERQRTTTTAAREVAVPPAAGVGDGAVVSRVTEAPRGMAANAPDDGELARQYAISLSVAANHAIGARWFRGGENPHPITYATGLDLARELRKENVPLELACNAVAAVCQASKKDKPMSTISYFRQPILEAARAEEQRVLNRSDAGGNRGGPPASIASLVDPTKARRDRERRETDELAHRQARSAAAIAWGKDPANALALQAIQERVHRKFEGQPDKSWVSTARSEMIVDECAKAAQFPDFDTWIRTSNAEPAKPAEPARATG